MDYVKKLARVGGLTLLLMAIAILVKSTVRWDWRFSWPDVGIALAATGGLLASTALQDALERRKRK